MGQPSLHEQYETLLRRGMPEHPRLRMVADGRWYFMDGDREPWCHPDDARDLITMHALRWVYNHADVEVRFQYTRTIQPPRSLESMYDPDAQLAAIMAATEHLEAK